MLVSKEILMLGIVGAVSVFAARKVVMLNPVYVDGGGKGVALPIPTIAPKNGFGLEWAILPAVAAYFISK